MNTQVHFHDPQNLHISVQEDSHGDTKWVRITLTDGSGDPHELIMYDTTWGTIRSLLHFAEDTMHGRFSDEEVSPPYDETNMASPSVTAKINEWLAAPMCPRCGGAIPNNEQPGAYMGAVSRTDNSTEICSSCGSEEALQDLIDGGCVAQSEWFVTQSDKEDN